MDERLFNQRPGLLFARLHDDCYRYSVHRKCRCEARHRTCGVKVSPLPPPILVCWDVSPPGPEVNIQSCAFSALLPVVLFPPSPPFYWIMTLNLCSLIISIFKKMTAFFLGRVLYELRSSQQGSVSATSSSASSSCGATPDAWSVSIQPHLCS